MYYIPSRTAFSTLVFTPRRAGLLTNWRSQSSRFHLMRSQSTPFNSSFTLSGRKSITGRLRKKESTQAVSHCTISPRGQRSLQEVRSIYTVLKTCSTPHSYKLMQKNTTDRYLFLHAGSNLQSSSTNQLGTRV